MASSCGPMPSKADTDYQAEDDHRTLSRAEEIKADASRMSGVKKQHRKITAANARISRSLSLGGKR
jgi:hypothetical protein